MAKQGPDDTLSAALLAWYGLHARDLPWRAKPGISPDPYRVWLSEIMLQQTTVQAVKAYFHKFVALWPNVEALAAAPLDDILKAWAGLGYYARARNLHACARAVVLTYGGNFPDSEAGLRALPGIGAYTAGAIAAIAYGRPHAAVDANVERVIARLYAIETPLPQAKPEIHMRTQALVPKLRPGDFAQALMDLGATVCTPKAPHCMICPWTEHCLARRHGLAQSLPRRQPKKIVPTRRGTAFWIERADGAILLRRRPESGLLGGMMEIPSGPWSETPEPRPERHAPLRARWTRLEGEVTHTFTHFHLELVIQKTTAGENFKPGPNCRWVPRAALASEALPTVMKKIVTLVLTPLLPAQSAGRRGQKGG